MNYLKMAVQMNIKFKGECEQCLIKGKKADICDVDSKCPLEEVIEEDKWVRERLKETAEELKEHEKYRGKKVGVIPELEVKAEKKKKSKRGRKKTRG